MISKVVPVTSGKTLRGKQVSFFSHSCLVTKMVFFFLVFFVIPATANDDVENTSNLILDTSLPQNKDTIIVLKNSVRTLIGRLGNTDNIDSRNRDTAFASIRKHGTQASASCGHIAFVYEQVLHDHKIDAHLISFYFVDGDIKNGHTATEVSLNNKEQFVVDPHVGIVWQNEKNEWADAAQVGCQALCYHKNFEGWGYYPSSSGKERYNPTLIPDVLFFMYPPAKLNPAKTISAIGRFRPNDFENRIDLEELLVFKSTAFDEIAQQKFIEFLGAGHGLTMKTKLTYYDHQSCLCP